MGSILKRRFDKLARTTNGTLGFIEEDMTPQIDAYWGRKEKWIELPEKLSEMKHFTDWNKVVHMNHGYDESKPESELNIEDMKKATKFRGGKLLSNETKKGDWSTNLNFMCAFNHIFKASPMLVLEGGHWCDICERESWSYGERAKRDPFFAQVWNPLHNPNELREYIKEVREPDSNMK